MKKYSHFINENVFSEFFNRDKKSKKEDIKDIQDVEDVEIEKMKEKSKNDKPKRESDLEMEELISEIKNNFEIDNLTWDNNSGDHSWTYILDGIKIKVKTNGMTYHKIWNLEIDDKRIETSLISDELSQDLIDFFADKEKNVKILKNSEYFSKVIPSLKNAKKYNL